MIKKVTRVTTYSMDEAAERELQMLKDALALLDKVWELYAERDEYSREYSRVFVKRLSDARSECREAVHVYEIDNTHEETEEHEEIID